MRTTEEIEAAGFQIFPVNMQEVQSSDKGNYEIDLNKSQREAFIKGAGLIKKELDTVAGQLQKSNESYAKVEKIVDDFYADEDSNADLCDIGEAIATHFGYL